LFTYSLLGASAGAIGGVAGYVGGLRTTQSALFILANVTLLVIGVYALRGTAGIPLLERAGGRLAQRVGTGPLLGRLFRSERFSGVSTPLAIGVVWGFVPCGLIYTVLALALFSGGALAGALVMAALWAGTVPSLAAAGWAIERVKRRLGARALQRAVGVVLLVFALLGLYRVLFAPNSAALDALCRLP
jgi:sulfite exporter TauE/SafE